MSDELDERRLRRSVRGALDDIIAAAPPADQPSRLPRHRRERSAVPRNPWPHVAAALTATAGLIGIVALANRDDDAPAAGDATDVLTTSATGVTSLPTAPTSQPSPNAAATTSSTAAAVVATGPEAGECGGAAVPDGATGVQSITGDIDGDAVDDTVTLYSTGIEWRVHVTSSARRRTSDTAIETTLDEIADEATVALADIDDPPAIMVTLQGPNDLGITANFTFLTLTPDYCVAQWIYRNARGFDEPFEWVALQEPGHVTGMICDGEPGARVYRLVDSEQDADGAWRVINRTLTHDFTRAEISFPPEETVPDSPDFAARYGSIVGCD